MSTDGSDARDRRQPGRRRVLGASALGLTSLTLPAATGAASGAVSPSGYPLLATGGTVTDTTDGATTYVVHTFTSDGTFVPSTELTVEYVIVAGGGGGGGGSDRNRGAGGGGAGGYRSSVDGTTGGAGGAGRSSRITGSAVTYSPGGTGGEDDADGARASATVVGGGGGGASVVTSSTEFAGGAGRAGIVIVRYALPA